MRRALLIASLVAALGCGDGGDPCADATAACVALAVESIETARIDQLELDILYGGIHATVTVQAGGGQVASLPISTAILLEGLEGAATEVGVVAAGKLSGVVLGTGAASATLGPTDRAELAIVLSDTQDCVAAGLYCGGDKLAGDPDTLYQCNGGGVPLARGKCIGGCVARPGDDDECRGAGGPCEEGGFYCGGDKLAGDPQTRYRCEAGVGVAPELCPNGCIISPPGKDDECR